MSVAKKNQASKPVNQTIKQTAKVADTANDAATETLKSASAPYLSALDSNVATPDQMMHAGTEAVKDFIAAGTEEVKKTQEKVLLMSQENIEKWSRTTDKTVRNCAEIFAANKDQVDAILESCQIMSELARELRERSMAEANALFSENVELSKDLLACRTVNDLVEIQNRALQTNLSRIFNHGAYFSDAWFKLVTEAVEPINTQNSQMTAKLNRSLAA